MKIRDQKNFWSGLMFIAFGAFFVGWAQQYDMGTAARMGPAFFPTMLGGIMFVLGVIVLIEGLAKETRRRQNRAVQLQGAGPGAGCGHCVRIAVASGGLFVSLFVLIGVSGIRQP